MPDDSIRSFCHQAPCLRKNAERFAQPAEHHERKRSAHQDQRRGYDRPNRTQLCLRKQSNCCEQKRAQQSRDPRLDAFGLLYRDQPGNSCRCNQAQEKDVSNTGREHEQLMDAVQRKQSRNYRNANHDKRGKNNNDRRSRGPIEPTIDSQLNSPWDPSVSSSLIFVIVSISCFHRRRR
jgi:hypothetical protein